jgi:sugar phosphate isomerase/epimerase
MHLKSTFIGFLAVVSLFLSQSVLAQESVPKTHVAHAGLSKLKWQLACRGSTFHDMTTFEMIDLLHSLNFHHIELSPGQSLSADHADVKIGQEMTADQVAMLSAKLKSVGMDIVSYGITDSPSNEAGARQLFEFGKKLKVKNIVMSDPSDDSLDMLDKLAGEFSINVAIVTASAPDAVLKKLQDRSARLGVCADVAQWRKAGVDPVAAATTLKARIIEFHLQDFDAHGQETSLGSGTVDPSAFLKQLKDENFKGICCISYETGSGPELLGHFVTSVNWLSDRINELAGTQ